MKNLQRIILEKKLLRAWNNTKEIGAIAILGVASAVSEIALVFALASENPEGTNHRPEKAIQALVQSEVPARNCKHVGRFALRLCD